MNFAKKEKENTISELTCLKGMQIVFTSYILLYFKYKYISLKTIP